MSAVSPVRTPTQLRVWLPIALLVVSKGLDSLSTVLALGPRTAETGLFGNPAGLSLAVVVHGAFPPLVASNLLFVVTVLAVVTVVETAAFALAAIAARSGLPSPRRPVRKLSYLATAAGFVALAVHNITLILYP